MSGLRLLNRTFWSPLGTHLRSALVLRWETSKIRSDTLDKIGESGSLRKRGATFAVRNLLDTSLEVRELANSEVVRRLVEAVLGPGSFAVQGILFDKIPDVNWKVLGTKMSQSRFKRRSRRKASDPGPLKPMS